MAISDLEEVEGNMMVLPGSFHEHLQTTVQAESPDVVLIVGSLIRIMQAPLLMEIPLMQIRLIMEISFRQQGSRSNARQCRAPDPPVLNHALMQIRLSITASDSRAPDPTQGSVGLRIHQY